MSGFEALFMGSAATGTAAAAGTAATAGLFGVGGAFSWGQTLMTLGTLASFGGGMQKTAEADYARSLANYNAALIEHEARNKAKEAGIKKAAHRRQIIKGQGKQRAVAAQSGLLVDSGSMYDVLEESAVLAELDQLRLGWGASEDYGAMTRKAAGTRYAGEVKARAKEASGLLGMGTSLLTSVGKYGRR